MFSNAEYRDMHYVYGFCDGNAAEAEREYAIRFPQRKHPRRRVFEAIHGRLGETGILQQHHRGRPRGNVQQEIEVLDIVHAEPSISTRQIARRIGMPQSSVWRVLHDQGLHPFHVRPVQELTPKDHGCRREYCRWLLHKTVDDPDFLNHVLWTDEADFTRDGIMNLHNLHVWSDQNPRATRISSYQHQFNVNVWAGIVGGSLIGPYVLPDRIGGAQYLQFLQDTLHTLLEDVPLNTRQHMWYQQDGAPAHFALPVRRWLDEHYPGRWIGRRGPVAWPARSPDLTPLDFFLWGYMKDRVYATEITCRDILLQRIDAAAADIRQQNGLLDSVHNAIRERARACLRARGEHFEQLLQ
ncbi:PREDICTED: uncharacterized protein LOC105560328 [Vollenhovia emeryi]|uniref:uncharacterized protein LOC105560328 n=1 Tax=Vollenhovia emeryi TaxID=411798 RepID=UPI0005F3CA52|nr:PREDICTED: uncharacterized protein LOC105560328 [Vollenhovia emeryi]